MTSHRTFPGWSKRTRRDAGLEEGSTGADLGALKPLRREVKELKRAKEMLKTVSAFLTAEPGRLRRNDRVH